MAEKTTEEMQGNVGQEQAALIRLSNGLKHEALMMAGFACESVKPQVREQFKESTVEALQQQYAVADVMLRQGWYVPLPQGGETAKFTANLEWASAQAMGPQQTIHGA